MGNDIPGDAISLTCKFSIGDSQENGMFNAVSCCTYGNTIDDVKHEMELNKMKKVWKDNGLKTDEIKFEATNWKLLDGLRITKRDSFDFMVETIGVFTNQEIVQKACDIIVVNLEELDELIEKDKLEIRNSNTTMDNCYDVILTKGDYTIGKILEFALYTKYYEGTSKLSFCGFVKEHPHRNDCIIRLAYNDESNKSIVAGDLKVCIQDLVKVYKKILTLV